MNEALLEATKYGFIDCMRHLLVAGAMPTCHDIGRNSCLHRAVIFTQGDVDMVKMILMHCSEQEKISLVNLANDHCHTALSLAAKHGCIECLKVLIESGGNVNFRHPLNHAVTGGHVECAEILVKSGAEVNPRGRIPPIVEAVVRNHRQLIKVLTDNNADVNVTFLDSNPLIVATSYGRVECIRDLLQAGADINLTNRLHGHNALFTAINNRHVTSLELLLQYNPQVDIQDSRQGTPLISSMNQYLCGHDTGLDLMKIVIRHGCDVNLPGRFPRKASQFEKIQLPFELAIRAASVPLARSLWLAGCETGESATWCDISVPWYALPHGSHCNIYVTRAFSCCCNMEHLWSVVDNEGLDRNKKNIIQFLSDTITHPHSLLIHCRRSIRQHLATKIKEKVDSLKLPNLLKDFLNIVELDSIHSDLPKEEEENSNVI